MAGLEVENSEMQNEEAESHQVQTGELENMSDGDLSNLEMAPAKVEGYL